MSQEPISKSKTTACSLSSPSVIAPCFITPCFIAPCFIALGSNLNDPLKQLNAAKKALETHPDITLLARSSIYQSEAFTLDDEPQNDYLNAVIKIQTGLDAEPLLDILQAIENEQGRTREKRWGSRTLDLDIILYGEQKISTSRLTVPHKEMQKRNFVLLPLQQISPDVIIPGKEHLKILLKKTVDQTLNIVGEFNE